MTADTAISDMARALYAAAAERVARVRARLDRPLTLTDKLLAGHLDDPDTQDIVPGESYLQLRPDRVAFQDVLGQTGMLQFMQTGLPRVAVPTTIHCDHLIQARRAAGPDLAESLAENGEVYAFLRAAAAKYGAGFWEPGAGIIHQVILENYAFPGAMIVATDSHTPNAGGLGAFAVGVGGADAVEAIAGMPWELLYPKRIAVVLTGRLNGWAAPKDVILHIAGRLGVAGGTNAAIEYIGPGAAAISATGKATIANMGAELGATASVFGWDETMAEYLTATGRAALVPLAEAARGLVTPDAAVLDDPARHYDAVLELDLSTLEPHVSGPHSPDRARPISALAAEIADPASGFRDGISAALIGSCTNSSYEDMCRAADVAAQGARHGLSAQAPFFVAPGSDRVRATIERDGQLRAFETMGAAVLANACGPCIGQWRRDGAAAETGEANAIVTSFNRNFPGRNDGSAATMNFIASPEIVTALALAGRLSFNPLTDTLTAADGSAFRLTPPAPAPATPSGGFADRQAAYVPPPADGSGIEVAIAPDSTRLQALRPWPRRDPATLADMPVLAKTRGKTTTDQISPAGPWLALRGHLDRFSDNLLTGAVNAFTGETGTGRDALSGEPGLPFAAVARRYNAAGRPWAIVGDRNYGEGSSREHAALSPRLLGGAVVIARSFARIHETNLKKQGLLALTFADPDDYDRILEDDRIALVGVDGLAPGIPVECRIAHADGRIETLRLNHSYAAAQIGWFRAGSALNAMRPAAA
jgi:aconitate hydratase